jgi:hypothetical protein
MDVPNSKTYQGLVWRKKKPIFVSAFLYGCFCVSCMIIPDTVNVSYCFAYFFALFQMIEVASFMDGVSVISCCLLCTTLFTASIMPTMQMYQIIVGFYSKELDTIYKGVYMLKEIGLHTARIYTGGNKVSPSVIHLTLVVCTWISLETVSYIMIIKIEEDFYEYVNLVYIVRLTPLFYMACLTLLS